MYWNHFKTDQVVDGEIINPHYSCFNEKVFSLTTAGLAILTDVLILTIPIAMTWSLQLNLRRKLAVVAVLSLGWVVVIVGCIRFKSFYDFFTKPSEDPTYSIGVAISGIETNLAIIASCGPAIKAIMSHFAPRLFGSSSGTRPSGDVAYSAQGCEMHCRSTQKGNIYSGPSTPSRRAARDHHRDIDADSQEEIIKRGSLGWTGQSDVGRGKQEWPQANKAI
jgi:hypothetical protein